MTKYSEWLDDRQVFIPTSEARKLIAQAESASDALARRLAEAEALLREIYEVGDVPYATVDRIAKLLGEAP